MPFVDVPELADALRDGAEPPGESEPAGSALSSAEDRVVSSEGPGACGESVTGSGGLPTSRLAGSLGGLVSSERGGVRNDETSRGALRPGAGRCSSRWAAGTECSRRSIKAMGGSHVVHDEPERRCARPTWISVDNPNATLHRRIDARAGTQTLLRA